jgi:hypothetical protein
MVWKQNKTISNAQLKVLPSDTGGSHRTHFLDVQGYFEREGWRGFLGDGRVECSDSRMELASRVLSQTR